MVINARVLNIRKHKNYTFFDTYTGEVDKIQFIVSNKMLESYSIDCGDYIKIDGTFITNNKGEKIIEVKKIIDISKAKDWSHYKGIVNKNNDDIKREILFNSRNAGNQLSILKYKKNLLKKIDNILSNEGFENMTSLLNVVERQKNGSKVIEAEICNRDNNQPKFLRSTFENQLKQACSILLKSVYCIDKAFRNMGENSGHLNEFLLLEMISLDYKIDDMIEFIYQMDSNAREEFTNSFGRKELFVPKIEMFDYKEIIKQGKSFDILKKENDNILITNYPANSPYIRRNYEGEKVETRWYMRGKYIGHFYEDENDINEIKESVKTQNELNNVIDDEVNQLEYFNWGLPKTTSFGVSIDRWLQLSLNEKNINTVANPLGLDYEKNKKENNKKL